MTTVKIKTKLGEFETPVKKHFAKLNLVIHESVKKERRFDVYFLKGAKKLSPPLHIVEGRALTGGSLCYIYSEAQVKERLKECQTRWPKTEFFISEEKPTYTLTHPQTGFSVKTFSSLAQALKAIKELNQNSFTFPETTDPKAVSASFSPDQMTALVSILRRYP